MSHKRYIIIAATTLIASGCTQPTSQVIDMSSVNREFRCENSTEIKSAKKHGTYTIDQFKMCPLNQNLLVEAVTGGFDTESNQITKKVIANKLILAVDLNFDAFKKHILRNDLGVQAVPKFIRSIIPIAGVTGAASAQVVAGTQIVTDGYSALQSDFLGIAAPALLKRIEKDRTAVRAAIRKQIHDHNATYLYSTLVADIARYEQLGDFLNAIERLSETQDPKNDGEKLLGR